MSQTSEAFVAKHEVSNLSRLDTGEDVLTDGDEVYTLRPLAREKRIAKVVKAQAVPFRYIEDDILEVATED